MWSRTTLIDQFRMGNINGALYSRMQNADDVSSYDLSKTIDVEKCHNFPVNSLALDNVDSRYLISSNTAGHIYIHDTTELSDAGTIKVICKIARDHRHCHTFSVETVQWYPVDTGVFTSSGMDKSFRIWDANRLKPVYNVRFSGRVYKHDLSPTNNNLVLVATENSYAQVLDLKTGSKLHQLSGAHSGKILQCQWSPVFENICVTGGADGRCVFWDIRYSRGYLLALDIRSDKRGREEHRKAHEGRIVSLAFTGDGLNLITFGADHSIRLWDTILGKNNKINFGRAKCESAKTIQIAVMNDTSPGLVAVPLQSTSRIYDTSTGICIKTLRAHLQPVNTTVYCSVNRRLYSAGKDNSILLWSRNDGVQEEVAAMRQNVLGDNWSDED